MAAPSAPAHLSHTGTFPLMAQTAPSSPPGFDEMTIEQQIDYIQSLWSKVAENLDGAPIPAWHIEELDRRLATKPRSAKSWSETRAELAAKYESQE